MSGGYIAPQPWWEEQDGTSSQNRMANKSLNKHKLCSLWKSILNCSVYTVWCCGNEQSITDGGPSASAQQVKEANKVKRSSKGQIGIQFWEGWFCHGEVTNSLITFFSSTIVAEADDWTTISFCDQIHHRAVDQTPELEIYKREAGGSEKGVHSCPRNSLCQFKNTWMHSSWTVWHI